MNSSSSHLVKQLSLTITIKWAYKWAVTTWPGTWSTKRKWSMKRKIFMKIKDLAVLKTVQILKVKSMTPIQIKSVKCLIKKSTIKMIKKNQELITIMTLINNQKLKTRPINPCKLLPWNSHQHLMKNLLLLLDKKVEWTWLSILVIWA